MLAKWLGCALLVLGAASLARADGAAGAKSKAPVHVGVGSGVFRPWDGNSGYNLLASAHVGLGSDRFWVGAEFEFRKFQAELKRDFHPDMNSFAIRFSFQYHPFPQWWLSPYVGVSVGLQANRVEENKQRYPPFQRVRDDWSGGTSLLALAGFQVPLFTERLHFFGEGRIGTSTDIWERSNGNVQFDQVGGIAGLGGLRVSF